jgi:hypothetical protein
LLSSVSLCTENPKQKLPETLNSSIGTEFYFSFLPTWETVGDMSGLRIYVISNEKTKVKVEVKERGFEEIKYIVPNEITEFKLSTNIGQPYRRTPFTPAIKDTIFKNTAVHIIADEPILCYAMTRFQYNSDGFIVLPVNTLGKEHILATYADIASNSGQWLPAMFNVVATQDNTKILFTMGGTDWSKTVSGQLPGEKTSWNLNTGDILTVASLGNKADLSGSQISANKPVSVVSGSYSTYVPTTCGCSSVLEEMELPLQMWGTEYFVPNIAKRKKSSMIKIFVKEPKTNIYKNYELIGMIKNAGGVLGTGYLEMRADSAEAKPIIISGDKPINVTLFNTGGTEDNVHTDPFKMTLIPTELFQTEATFINIGNKLLFEENYITIFYQANDANQIPDDLEIANVKNDEFVWQKLSKFSSDAGTKLIEPSGMYNYFCKTIPLPEDGIYKLKANKKFQAYSYGFSWCDAYGFPSFVGESEFKVAPVDSLHPIMKVQYNNCEKIGGIVLDSSDFGISSKIATIYLHTDLSYNFKLYHSDFMPCVDSVADWYVERINKNEDAYATITMLDCRSNEITNFIEYADTNQFFTKELKHDFKKIKPGEKISKELYAYNKLSEYPALIESIKFKSSGSDLSNKNFELLDKEGNRNLSLPIIIPPLDSVKFIISFSSDELGNFKDTIGWGDDCFFEYNTLLAVETKTGIVKTEDMDFQESDIGTSKIQELLIENTGNDNLEIYQIVLPELIGIIDNNEYKIFSSDEIESLNISPTNPLLILPGDTRNLEIIFIPDSAKDYLDSITIRTNSIENLFNPDSVSLIKGKGLEVISVNENKESDIAIFPNPANNLIQISNLPVNCQKIIRVSSKSRITF